MSELLKYLITKHKIIYKNRWHWEMWLPVQDGGVEGCGLIFCETTKIATSCWTTIDRRKTGEPAKKYTPHSKIKKKLQEDGRRGENMIKLDPLTAAWATHNLENNDTKEVLSLFWRFWVSCKASQPGDLEKRLGITRESDFEDQWDLITQYPQDWFTYCWRLASRILSITLLACEMSVIVQ